MPCFGCSHLDTLLCMCSLVLRLAVPQGLLFGYTPPPERKRRHTASAVPNFGASRGGSRSRRRDAEASPSDSGSGAGGGFGRPAHLAQHQPGKSSRLRPASASSTRRLNAGTRNSAGNSSGFGATRTLRPPPQNRPLPPVSECRLVPSDYASCTVLTPSSVCVGRAATCLEGCGWRESYLLPAGLQQAADRSWYAALTASTFATCAHPSYSQRVGAVLPTERAQAALMVTPDRQLFRASRAGKQPWRPVRGLSQPFSTPAHNVQAAPAQRQAHAATEASSFFDGA